MSTLARKSYLLGNCLLLLTLVLTGSCAIDGNKTYFLSVQYRPAEQLDPLVPKNKQCGLCLVSLPQQAQEDRLWYRADGYAWFLEKEPTALVGEALKTELQRLGFFVLTDPKACPERLEFQVRWFAPYGHNSATASLIIALALYSRNRLEPVWRGRLRAGSASNEIASSMQGQTLLIQKVVEEALAKAMQQLHWQPGLSQSLHKFSENIISSSPQP
jgi:hypothetical protein